MPHNLTDYRHIFLNDVPMMDVRAPVEFGQGAFPGVANLPLMDDGERQQVGTCYKHKGQEAAIALGHQLVSGTIKRQRIEAWRSLRGRIRRACCTAFVAGCARRSCSNGC